MWACFKPASGTVRTSENNTVETDCVAGHVRLELRNVVANYPFESSRGFPGSEPNSGHGDHSRLSCSEQKKILKRCRGLFYLCAGGSEARRFNRLLIDAGLIQGF